MTESEKSKKRILVVDDSHELVRMLANTLLPTHGFRSSYALDGRTALDKIRNEKPDLIILDLNLPQMTGLDVLETLAEENISTPVVLITGDGSEQSAVEAFRLGVKDYIVKPFTVDEVIDTIERTLGVSTNQDSEAALMERLFIANNTIRQLRTRMKQLLQTSTTVTGLTTCDNIIAETLRTALEQTGAGEALLFLQAESADGQQYSLKQGEAHVVRRRTPESNLIVADVLQHGTVGRRADFINGIVLNDDKLTRSILYAPIEHKDGVLGVLCVHHERAPRAFSEQDELFLSFLGIYTGIALHNADTITAAQRQRQQQHEALLRIVYAASAESPSHQLLADITAAVYRSLAVQACRLWLPQAADGALVCVADVGVSVESRQGQTAAAGDTLVRQVAESGQWAYRNEATEEAPMAAVESGQMIATHSALCVPILFQGTISGVLQLLNKNGGAFDEADAAHVQELAAAVGVAVATVNAKS